MEKWKNGINGSVYVSIDSGSPYVGNETGSHHFDGISDGEHLVNIQCGNDRNKADFTMPDDDGQTISFAF